eukprot:CAMPEP_0177646792 /NCGR_PEP_ID=MMETSP0447-20121125/9955_1 /TAXON_ID=0 /ORGANISM="Stygamoeba regulata, Strain BSH-02190019" /LENGTH=451 /DNA_ID=CAMNT_0019149333 /DNA_START=55 /DNA_END=1410 /DNA_ORIENTATION=+
MRSNNQVLLLPFALFGVLFLSTSLLSLLASTHASLSPQRHSQSSADPWDPVTATLLAGIEQEIMPGAVALVATQSDVLYQKAVGSYTYGIPPPQNPSTPPMEMSTRFDMASCTKVVATTSAVATLYQNGYLELDATVASYVGDAFSANGKQNITVLNCLLHNAGFPPDPNPNYWDASFQCPETAQPQPAENFSCQTKIYNSWLAQTLEYPVGSTYVYSDLSFISLQYVVGHVVKSHALVPPSELVPGCANGGPEDTQCYFEAFCRLHVFAPLQMSNTSFLPPQSVWDQCAPCENDTVYLHRVIQGQVSDGNAYALGGIAGHAGLFSTAFDVLTLARRVMFATPADSFLNQTTAHLFTTEYNHTQSSRALGWNTNDPNVTDEGWGLSCGSLSSTTWLHIGYTGTQVCGDPERQLITVLLANRVYPTSNDDRMPSVRRAFNTAVQKVFDSMHP